MSPWRSSIPTGSRCSSSQFFPGQIFLGDLFASLHLLCCLSSEEMCLALLLVQSALPWSTTLVQIKGLRLELFSWLGQSCGQQEGWKPAPVPSTSKSPLSQSSSKPLPNGERGTAAARALLMNLSPSLEADCHLIISAVIKGRELAGNPLQGVLVIENAWCKAVAY